MDQSGTRMIAGKLCALRSTVFIETFCYVTCVSDVEGVVRASEEVDKGLPADGRRRFPRREVGKVVWSSHFQSGPFNQSTRPIRRAVACSGHSTRFLTWPVSRSFGAFVRIGLP
jgi:hypothetical protein